MNIVTNSPPVPATHQQLFEEACRAIAHMRSGSAVGPFEVFLRPDLAADEQAVLERAKAIYAVSPEELGKWTDHFNKTFGDKKHAA